MKHEEYYPTRTADQIIWLSNFYHKLPTWFVALDISSADLAEIIADTRWLIYVLQDWLPAVRTYNLSCTAAAKDAQTGNGGLIALPEFTPPPLPGVEGTLPAVLERPEGGLSRLFDLIAEIKENDACTDPMCLDLGIIGSAESGPDTATITPEITAARSGSTVKIGWGWDGQGKFLDAIEIVVDRATGTFVPLTTDTTPNYTDSATQPATSAIWKYKAIYRIDDQQVGQWSPVVSVVVGG